MREYFDQMFPEAPDTNEHRHSQALVRAHEIRKFEIDMYWKRATYFWAFQTVIFGGIVLLINNNNILLAIILALLGIIISLAWVRVNEGSKFWQENWEYHIDLLEEAITGNLYKTVLSKPKNLAPYSVSNVNLAVSRVFVIAWCAIYLYTLFHLPDFRTFSLCGYMFLIITPLLIIGGLFEFCHTNTEDWQTIAAFKSFTIRKRIRD